MNTQTTPAKQKAERVAADSALEKYALSYAQKGWHVFPLHYPQVDKSCSCANSECKAIGKHPMTTRGLKDATIDERLIKAWWKKNPKANIGIVTGKASDIVVIDLDGATGAGSWKNLLAAHQSIEAETLVQQTGNGRHLLFAYPVDEEVKSSVSKLAAKVDVRANGGYIVAAPSLHQSGKHYQWLGTPSLRPLPEWLKLLIGSSREKYTAPEITQNRSHSNSSNQKERYGQAALDGELRKLAQAPEHTRNSQLFKSAATLGGLIATGCLAESIVIDELSNIARKVGLTMQEIQKTISSGIKTGKLTPREPQATTVKVTSKPETKKNKAIKHSQILTYVLGKINFIDFQKEARNQNHSGNIKKEHRAVLCIDEVRAKFMECGFGLTRKEESTFVFNGEFWGIISSEQIKHFLGEAAAKMGISPLDARSSAYKDLLFCQFVSDSFLNVIESDEDSIKINLQNGTFEISENSQQLREFKAEDFLTYQLGFSYQPEAKAPKFLKYLDQVLPDKSLQMIVAEFFGYVFTRKLRLEKALLLYGQGQNGKSVLFHIIHALLGRENMRSFSLTDLLQEHNRALISNCLLNYGTEINASTTRDIFKNLVSGEPIMARMKYGNSFIMDSYGKLCFNCNELPSDIEQNDAYYRRLLIIPFDVKISNEAIDPQLAQKIINSELSGVFNWVLEGLRRIIQHKIFTHSERMEEMLRQYRKESDNVALFIEDNSSIQPEYAIDGLLKDVHSNYKSYCQDCGYRALGRNNFTKRMEALGFEKSHGRLGTVLEKL